MTGNRKVAIQIQYDERWRDMLEIARESGFKYVAMGFGSSKCFHSGDWEQSVFDLRNELDLRIRFFIRG